MIREISFLIYLTQVELLGLMIIKSDHLRIKEVTFGQFSKRNI